MNKTRISPRKAYTDIQSWSEWGTGKIGSVLLYPVFTRQHSGHKGTDRVGTAPQEGQARCAFCGQLLDDFQFEQEQGSRRQILSVVGSTQYQRSLGRREWRYPQLTSRYRGSRLQGIPGKESSRAGIHRYDPECPAVSRCDRSTRGFTNCLRDGSGVRTLAGKLRRTRSTSAAQRADQELKRVQKS